MHILQPQSHAQNDHTRKYTYITYRPVLVVTYDADQLGINPICPRQPNCPARQAGGSTTFWCVKQHQDRLLQRIAWVQPVVWPAPYQAVQLTGIVLKPHALQHLQQVKCRARHGTGQAKWDSLHTWCTKCSAGQQVRERLCKSHNSTAVHAATFGLLTKACLLDKPYVGCWTRTQSHSCVSFVPLLSPTSTALHMYPINALQSIMQCKVTLSAAVWSYCNRTVLACLTRCSVAASCLSSFAVCNMFLCCFANCHAACERLVQPSSKCQVSQ